MHYKVDMPNFNTPINQTLVLETDMWLGCACKNMHHKTHMFKRDWDYLLILILSSIVHMIERNLYNIGLLSN